MRIFIPTLRGILLKYLIYIPLTCCFILLFGFSFNVVGVVVALLLTVAFVGSFALYDLLVVLPRKYIRDNRLRDVSAALPGVSLATETWNTSSSVLESFRYSGAGRPVTQLTHQNWRMVDYSFDKIVSTRFGDYVSGKYYFTIIELPLPRTLPNMVFDSHQTQGKQMRIRFDSNQQLKLEGNFDTYFDTYYPAHYQIDALSIITPEVMEALIAAKNYDIELFGNSLFLYSKMASASEVQSMIHKAEVIKSKLMNNIVTYADNRLTTDRRQTVHTYGMSIQKDFKNQAISLFVVSVICLVIGLSVLIPLLAGSGDADGVITTVIMFAITVVSTRSGIRLIRNGKRERELRRSLSKQ